MLLNNLFRGLAATSRACIGISFTQALPACTFTGQRINNKLDPEVADYVLSPMRDLFAKKIRKLSLENTLLSPTKIVLPVKRLRADSDTLIRLKKQKESPGMDRVLPTV